MIKIELSFSVIVILVRPPENNLVLTRPQSYSTDLVSEVAAVSVCVCAGRD